MCDFMWLSPGASATFWLAGDRRGREDGTVRSGQDGTQWKSLHLIHTKRSSRRGSRRRTGQDVNSRRSRDSTSFAPEGRELEFRLDPQARQKERLRLLAGAPSGDTRRGALRAG